MKPHRLLASLGFALGVGLSSQGLAQTPGDKLDRTHLPIPNTVRPTLVTYDAKSPDTKFPPIQQLRPPKGAPQRVDRPD